MAMKQAGFTLIELMIAMVAGSFVIGAAYYLNGVAARAFSEQARISDTQMSLRSAMEQLRRDFSRAGYLHTPNSNLAPNCEGGAADATVTPRQMRALDIARDGSLGNEVATGAEVQTLLGMPDTNRTRADLVTLWGNYATADAYLADPAQTTTSATQTVIVFQRNSESFRRSFFNGQVGTADATYDQPRFEGTFRINRVLRVEHEGRFFFRNITGVNGTDGQQSVTVEPALPYCFDPTRWTAVAPVMRLRYALESDAADELSRLRPATASLGSRRTLLVRREVNDTDNSLVANSSRVVLDYAVEFAVDAVISNTAPDQTPDWGIRQRDVVAAAADATPERFRSLIVTLSSRSAEADPNLPSLPRARFNDANLLDSPLLTFRVIDPARANIAAFARVRTMRSEIFLQNL